MRSNHPLCLTRRRLLVSAVGVAGPLLLEGCATGFVPRLISAPSVTHGAFVMPDGTVLDYRIWRAVGEPRAIVLALHGMNDSRDAWEVPAPEFAAAGIAIVAPDQRGFGATATRGRWAGTATMVADAARMVRLLHAAHPRAKLYVMGESMGGAVAICLAASPDPPPYDGTILISPAVWGRSEMNIFERASLWVMDRTLPGLRLTGSVVKVTASDNRAALIRLGEDPLTIRATRVDAINGLVNLMSDALALVPRMRGPVLFLYGGKDELIPKRAAKAAWDDLPPGVRIAYYPDAYHLMLRDRARAVPIADVIAWMDDPRAPLPSGAGGRAREWLARAEPAVAGAA